eukprot:g9584.t1
MMMAASAGRRLLRLLGAQGLLMLTAAAATGLPTGMGGLPSSGVPPSASHPGPDRAMQLPQEPLATPTPPAAADSGSKSSSGDDDGGTAATADVVFPADESVLTQGCTFFLVRHGQSHPNIAGKIVSGMNEGIDPANGLTELGLEQARTAGRELKEVLLRAGCSPANTIVLTSPFSRAKETAEAIRECLDCELREERDLRERFFGDFDGQEDAPSYAKVWALDALSARHGELGVEPAAEVAARGAAVVRRARKEVSVRQRFYSGDDGQPFPPGPSAVVLVSHGDALQVLQCALAGRPVEQHRSLPHLENCGIRVLRPPTEKSETIAAEGTKGGAELELGGEEVGVGGDGRDGEEGGGAGALKASGARMCKASGSAGGQARDGGGGGEIRDK